MPDNKPSKSAMKVAQLQHTGPQLPKHPNPNQFSRQLEETCGLSKPDATPQQGHWSRPGQNPSWPRCPPPTYACRWWQDRRLDPKRTPTLRNPSRSLIGRLKIITNNDSRPNGISLYFPEKYHPNRRFFSCRISAGCLEFRHTSRVHCYVRLKHCLAPRRSTTRNTIESQP